MLEVDLEEEARSPQQYNSQVTLTKLSLEKYLNQYNDVFEHYVKHKKRNQNYFSVAKMRHVNRVYLDVHELFDGDAYEDLMQRMTGKVSEIKKRQHLMRRRMLEEDRLDFSTLPNLIEALKDGRQGEVCISDSLPGFI